MGWSPHQGLTCFCRSHFLHQLLHTGHVSVLDSKDQVLFTTHSDYRARLRDSESRKKQDAGPNKRLQFTMPRCFGGLLALGSKSGVPGEGAACQPGTRPLKVLQELPQPAGKPVSREWRLWKSELRSAHSFRPTALGWAGTGPANFPGLAPKLQCPSREQSPFPLA